MRVAPRQPIEQRLVRRVGEMHLAARPELGRPLSECFAFAPSPEAVRKNDIDAKHQHPRRQIPERTLDWVACCVEHPARDVGAMRAARSIVRAQAQRRQLALERLGQRCLSGAWKSANQVQRCDGPASPSSRVVPRSGRTSELTRRRDFNSSFRLHPSSLHFTLPPLASNDLLDRPRSPHGPLSNAVHVPKDVASGQPHDRRHSAPKKARRRFSLSPVNAIAANEIRLPISAVT